MFSIFSKRLEYLEKSLQRISERRKKSIYNSLIRPLYQEIFKFFFIITVMILDTFILLELIFIFNIPYNFIIFTIIGFTIIFSEYKIYNSIWGINGIWSIDKYKKIK